MRNLAFFSLILLATFCAFWLPLSPADAGWCGNSYSSYSSPCYSSSSYYSTPYYSAPYYPSCVYTPTYEVTKVITQPILVPATVFQFLPAYSGGSTIQGYAATGAVGTAQGYASPQGYASGAGGQTVGSPAASPGASMPQPLDLPQAQPTEQAPATSPVSTGASEASGDALAVLNNRCAKCHTGPSSDGRNGQPFAIFDSPNVLANLDSGQRARCALAARTAWMPKGANRDPKSPLACPDGECAVLDAWAEQ